MVSEIIEEFRMIQGFEDYQISNMGRVMRVKTNKILKPAERRGYLAVNLYKDKKTNNTQHT